MGSKSHGHKHGSFNPCIHKIKIKKVKYLTVNCKDCGGYGGYSNSED